MNRDLPQADRRVTDDYVAKAFQFQTMFESGKTPQSRARIAAEYPDAYAAYDFWVSGSSIVEAPPPPLPPPATAAPNQAPPPPPEPVGILCSEAMAKAECEALILAGKSPEKIGPRVGLTPESVRFYESWYFDVRDRLKCSGWIAANVIGNVMGGAPAVIIPNLIRAYGYYTKSAKIVQAAAWGFDPAASRTAAKGGVKTFFPSDGMAAGAIKSALSVRMMPLGYKTYARMVELHTEMVDAAARTGTEGETDREAEYREAIASLKAAARPVYGAAPTDLSETRLGPRLINLDQTG